MARRRTANISSNCCSFSSAAAKSLSTLAISFSVVVILFDSERNSASITVISPCSSSISLKTLSCSCLFCFNSASRRLISSCTFDSSLCFSSIVPAMAGKAAAKSSNSKSSSTVNFLCGLFCDKTTLLPSLNFQKAPH